MVESVKSSAQVKVATATSGPEAQEAADRPKKKITSKPKPESYKTKDEPLNVETSVSKLAMIVPLPARRGVPAVRTANADARAGAQRRRSREIIMRRVCLVRTSVVILVRRVITIPFQD
jgi:hypothetical protein